MLPFAKKLGYVWLSSLLAVNGWRMFCHVLAITHFTTPLFSVFENCYLHSCLMFCGYIFCHFSNYTIGQNV